jgi:hypothetical protein
MLNQSIGIVSNERRLRIDQNIATLRAHARFTPSPKRFSIQGLCDEPPSFL